MTHALTSTPKSAAPMLPDAPEAVGGLRSLADCGEFHELCSHKACRRAKSCRGPVGRSRYFIGAALPSCIAIALDDFYAPVARWNAFRDRVITVCDKLRAAGHLTD